jgi:hypothetical protein
MTNLGLIVFIAVLVVNILGLLLDGFLLLAGFRTITNRVRKNPILGFPILLLQLVGLAGLAIHFYG